MNKRWQCPKDEHEGVLAPSKMRRDDIRRYCLPCSTATGRLVERVAPALEKEREAREEARKAKEKRARERAKAAKEAAKVAAQEKVTIGDTNLLEEAPRFWKALMKHQLVVHKTRALPDILIRRSPRKGRAVGHGGGGRVTMTLGTDVDLASALDLLVHELCHNAVGGRHGHDMTFRKVLRDTACDLWDIEIGVIPDANRYILDDVIVRELRKKLGLPEGPLGWIERQERIKERRAARASAPPTA